MSTSVMSLVFSGLALAVVIIGAVVGAGRSYGGLVERLARIEAKLDAYKSEQDRQGADVQDHEHRLSDIERIGSMERIGVVEGRKPPSRVHNDPAPGTA